MWSKKGRHKRGKRKEGWIEGRMEREKEHKREEKIKRQKGKEKEWKGERSKQGNERKGGEERKGKGEKSKIRKEFYANFVLSFKEKSTPSGNTRAACLDRFRLDLPQGALPDTSGLKAIVFSISHSSISLSSVSEKPELKWEEVALLLLHSVNENIKQGEDMHSRSKPICVDAAGPGDWTGSPPWTISLMGAQSVSVDF